MPFMGTPEIVPFTGEQTVLGDDGIAYNLVIEGGAEITRGPLGRILDLCDQIGSEGLQVPPLIATALVELQRPSADPTAAKRLSLIREYLGDPVHAANADPLIVLGFINGEGD